MEPVVTATEGSNPDPLPSQADLEREDAETTAMVSKTRGRRRQEALAVPARVRVAWLDALHDRRRKLCREPLPNEGSFTLDAHGRDRQGILFDIAHDDVFSVWAAATADPPTDAECDLATIVLAYGDVAHRGNDLHRAVVLPSRDAMRDILQEFKAKGRDAFMRGSTYHTMHLGLLSDLAHSAFHRGGEIMFADIRRRHEAEDTARPPNVFPIEDARTVRRLRELASKRNEPRQPGPFTE